MQTTDNPLAQFASWLAEAVSMEGLNHDAMALATADAAGNPDVRYVLLKRVDEEGLKFFTNRTSSKAEQLLGSGRAATTIYWPELDRQVRTRGVVEEQPRSSVEEYFSTRSRASQLGAWASHQSQTLSDMDELRARVEKITERFEGGDVPLPDFWTGFLLRPLAIEFWQEGEARLHERIIYERSDLDAPWRSRRLFP